MEINETKDSKNSNLKPFLRWAGGKQNLIKALLNYIPKDYQQHTYFEPFLGAGSMFFAIHPEKAILSDLNIHLINCYKMVRKNPLRIYKYLVAHKRNSSRDYYYQVREDFNNNINKATIAQAARFIYLNKTCFNGIFRVNASGFFNVPYGYKINPNIPSYQELINISIKLKRAEIFAFSFEKVLQFVNKGDFVYIDPPYPPLNNISNFTHYTKEKFDKSDQIKLNNFAEKLSSLGCYVLISNADTEIIKHIYSNWLIFSIEATRYITCKSRRYKVKELFITNYKPKH